jgi:tRNA A37 methylthiotransferase MiaB
LGFREGGQAGIETKRGCPRHCIYCADPIAKGKELRIRFEVCQEIIHRNLADELRWYAYCSPVPFSRELAKLMHRAGCVGINFGVDNGDEEMLRQLRRGFTSDDILNVARSCQEAGIAVMFDLMLGSPGETKASIARTIELMRQARPDRVGVAVGVRVYPGTELADLVRQEELREGLVGGEDPSESLFFIEPRIAPFAFELLDDLIGDDESFFFFDPSRPDRNYNYNANQLLVDAIRKGYRGAYWDILRRLAL